MGGFYSQAENHPDRRTPGKPRGGVHLVLLVRE
jgi:hypothetical protein